jgi:hypothetical protein
MVTYDMYRTYVPLESIYIWNIWLSFKSHRKNGTIKHRTTQQLIIEHIHPQSLYILTRDLWWLQHEG